MVGRYGLEPEALPVVEGLRSAIVSGGKIVEQDAAALAHALAAYGRFAAPGVTLFPEPYSDTGQWGPDPEGYGDRSIRQELTAFEAAPDEHDWVESTACLTAFGPLDQCAVTELLRVFSESGGTMEGLMAVMSSMKIAKGTKALVEAIASQATRADIRLNAPVRRVVQTADGVRV